MTVKFEMKRKFTPAGLRARKMLKKPREELVIGIMAPEAQKSPSHYKGATIGEVAFWNEYGTMTTPARSWLRDWFAGKRKKIAEQLIAATYRAIYDPTKPVEYALLDKQGKEYVKDIVRRIKGRIPPPNAEETLKQKQGDIPLIDREDFIKSIRHEVR